MVYTRKLYLITSTNLCPENKIEAKPPNLDSKGVEIEVAQLVLRTQNSETLFRYIRS